MPGTRLFSHHSLEPLASHRMHRQTMEMSLDFPMDIDCEREEDTKSMEDPIEKSDFYPDIEYLDCRVESVNFEGRRRDCITHVAGSFNKYIIIRSKLEAGKSPVHRGTVATGSNPASVSYQQAEVAIKLYPANVLANAGLYSCEDPIKEMKVLQFLRNQHPNILSMIACYRHSVTGLCYLEMPLLAGGDAITILEHYNRQANKPYFPMVLARTCIRNLLSALDHIHRLGITHHDISPEQLLYDPSMKQFVLIDFGMCIRQGRDKTTGSLLPYPQPHFCGKRGYWAPEIDSRSECPSIRPSSRDMWSVGPTIVMILTGQNVRSVFQQFGVLDQTYYRHAESRVVTVLSSLADGRGSDFNQALQLVARLMKFDPVDRITAAEALLDPWLNSDDVTERSN